jgi:hypothetical protein
MQYFLGNGFLSNTGSTLSLQRAVSDKNQGITAKWKDISAATGIINRVSQVTNSLRCNMNGETRCSIFGPIKSTLRHGFRQKSVSMEEAVEVSTEEAVSYSPSSKERGHQELAASLRGVRTSKDHSDTRHQGVRTECNGMIVIPTHGVGNKRLWTIEWCSS